MIISDSEQNKPKTTTNPDLSKRCLKYKEYKTDENITLNEIQGKLTTKILMTLWLQFLVMFGKMYSNFIYTKP